MKVRLAIVLVALCGAMSPLLSAQKSACSAAEATEIPITNFRLENGSIVDALRQTRRTADPNCLIITLEVVPFRTHPERNLNFAVKQATVAKILSNITLQDPRYTFERVNSKLIHVFPVQAKRNPKDLLNVEVKNFSASQTQFDSLLKYPNLHIPELQFEITRRSKKGGAGGSTFTGVDLPKVSVSLRSGTVRDVLNLAAQQTERFTTRAPSGWIFTFRVDKANPLGGEPSWDLF